MGVLDPDHGGAGSAGQYDGIVIFEDLNGPPGQVDGLLSKSAVEEGLAAASLLLRKIDLEPGPS